MIGIRYKVHGEKQLTWGEVQAGANTIKAEGETHSICDIPLDVPVSGTVYGTLLNYRGAYQAFETSMQKAPYLVPPKAPILYIKPVNTFRSFGAAIPLPTDVSTIEIGASLGIVIGKTAKRVTQAEALGYVQGYTIVNDVTIPHESVHRPAVKQKARDGFCPIGPWIVERDAVGNPNNLQIRVMINGEQRQENNTKNLVRSVETLITDVTAFMTLYAGDVLLVGVPENAPLAKENDQVTIEIEDIGTLKNTIEKVHDIGGRDRP